MTFEDYNFSNELMQSIKRMGYNSPTPIQEKTIPLILEGRDVIGESATGSGKTLAFGAGIVERVIPGKGLQALVLAPTRELAEQVKNSLVELAHFKKLKVIPVYGGVGIGPQVQDLKRADVVIATPGRLKDHLQRGTVDTSRIDILVLDEADRMLDMGFIEDIEFIIKSCKSRKQTLFFSATMPPQIVALSRKYLNNPTKVSAGTQVDPNKLKQIYYDVRRDMKISLLVHLIRNESSKLIMVFCNTRRNTDLVVKNLKANDVSAIAIHGGFAQTKRSKTMEMFNNGKAGVLVCTDVAARGLHIDDVSHVYNYDLPNDPTDYVHRIGRTARAGEEGIVVNLLCDYDHDNFTRVLQEYRYKIEKHTAPSVPKIRMQEAPVAQRRFAPRRRPRY